MFLRYYVDLPAPFTDVETALLESPTEWVPRLLRAAEDRGQRLLAEVGFDVDTRRVGRGVEIGFGEPNRMPAVTVLPMTWRATEGERLFPRLDADLEVAALGPARTQVSISARYRPPMGAVGRIVDRALLHRVAEATVKDFLDGVALRLGDRRAAAS